MPLILCECALHRFRQRPPNWTLPIKVILKFSLAPEQWLVCTIFSATVLLHLRTHSSKNYSLIFLHVFIVIFSKISPTNTPRMMNQSTLSTLRLLLFILTIQPFFLETFIFYFFMQLQDFYHKDGTRHTKWPPADNDRQPGRGPEALNYPEPARVGGHFQLLPLFLGSPGRKQSEPPPTLKTC